MKLSNIFDELRPLIRRIISLGAITGGAKIKRCTWSLLTNLQTNITNKNLVTVFYNKNEVIPYIEN